VVRKKKNNLTTINAKKELSPFHDNNISAIEINASK
jgi:hypothetical protein